MARPVALISSPPKLHANRRGSSPLKQQGNCAFGAGIDMQDQTVAVRSTLEITPMSIDTGNSFHIRSCSRSPVKRKETCMSRKEGRILWHSRQSAALTCSKILH